MSKTRKTLFDIGTGGLVLLALASAGILIRNEFTRSRAPGTIPRASIQSDWMEFAKDGAIMGDVHAPVTLVEFSDFECPYCQKLPEYLDSLRVLGREVRVIYRHFPGPGHKHAIAAVRSSECAAAQGAFSPMHAALTEFADSIGLADWKWFGRQAHVPDDTAFARCVRSTEAIQALARDTVAGNRLGVRGTPTILVNQHRYNGLPPFDSLLAYVDRAKNSRTR